MCPVLCITNTSLSLIPLLYVCRRFKNWGHAFCSSPNQTEIKNCTGGIGITLGWCCSMHVWGFAFGSICFDGFVTALFRFAHLLKIMFVTVLLTVSRNDSLHHHIIGCFYHFTSVKHLDLTSWFCKQIRLFPKLKTKAASVSNKEMFRVRIMS